MKITLTSHESSELRRFGDAMTGRNEYEMARQAYALAYDGAAEITRFDAVMNAYRAWLVFNETPTDQAIEAMQFQPSEI